MSEAVRCAHALQRVQSKSDSGGKSPIQWWKIHQDVICNTYYFPRALARRIANLLGTFPAVFLQGARQVGKTTLAKQIIKTGIIGHYFSFDDPVVLSAAMQDPAGFVRALPQRAVLDEVQRVPVIMPILKRRIDTHREAGDLLLTGSAKPLMLPRLSETLVGRMAIVTLMPLTQGEIEGREDRWLERVFLGISNPEFSPRCTTCCFG